MLFSDAESRLRIDLADKASALLSRDDLDRAVQRAVSDLSRFLPQDKVLDITLNFDVADEAWVSASSAGTYVNLANKPIAFGSDVVKNESGVACARGTDYYMDYMNGKITHISGGLIGNDENCTISYQKSKLTVDVGSIASELIRVDRVEYPIGNTPQSFVSFEKFGNLLSPTGEYAGSQVSMAEGKHLAVYYKSKHTAPTTDEEGTYPAFLDDTIILAASAYALLTAAMKTNMDAKDSLASAVALLAAMSGDDAEAALDKVETELAAGAVPLGKVSTEAAAAKSYLTTGEAKINTVNTGDNVPELYRDYATVLGQYVAGAYRDETLARISRAQAYIAEADSRLSAQQLARQQAEDYLSVASQRFALAERFRAESIERRNEAWSIWKDPRQYVGDFALTPPLQPAMGS